MPDNETRNYSLLTHYTDWLKDSLREYEKLAKRLVEHKAEKGRIVEAVVKSALRAILPGRFQIGTGFVISSTGGTSSQLDLVIYDGHFNSPILLEGGTGVFPIECVYGFVEVKSRLDRKELAKVCKAVNIVRDLAKEKHYVHYERKEGKFGPVVGEVESQHTLAPRSFVIAINSDYVDIERAEAVLVELTEQYRSHIHGLAILEKEWLFTQEATYDNPQHIFKRRQGDALAFFCRELLVSIQSIPMRPASMGRYLGLQVDGD
jgi:hypothetical protein